MKKIIIVLILIFIPIVKVKSYYCHFEDLSRLKKIASNINVSYNYEIKDDEALFDITLTNLTNELYVIDANGTKYLTNNNELTIKDYKSGSFKLIVYPKSGDCEEEILKIISITLPTYNKFHDDPLCDGIESYNLCQRWSNINLNDDEFSNKIKEYRKSLIKDEPKQEQPIEDDYSIVNLIFDFLIDYYYLVLLAIIIACSFGIYRINKQSNIYK